MLKQLVYRAGSHPQRSLKAFFAGIGLFVAGLAGLYANQDPQSWLARLAVVSICIGVPVAAYGYVGIFANRWAQILNRAEKYTNKSNNNT